MNSLSVQNLCLSRGDRLLFSGLSFTLGTGEALHLQGRNGAGKTSLLEALCGLRTPESGTMTGLPEPGTFHWLGHRNALNLALSPIENLRFWCGLQSAPAHRAADALARLGLQRAAQRPCAQLSTGQKRRAALARLCAVERPWWFLDEPLAGLDDEGLSLFSDLLAGHLKQGGAAVVTSHQPLGAATRSLRLA